MLTASSRRLSVLSTPPLPSSMIARRRERLLGRAHPDAHGGASARRVRASCARSHVSSFFVSRSVTGNPASVGPVGARRDDARARAGPATLDIAPPGRSFDGASPARLVDLALARASSAAALAALRAPAAAPRRAEPLRHTTPARTRADGDGGGRARRTRGRRATRTPTPRSAAPASTTVSATTTSPAPSTRCDQTVGRCRFTPDDSKCQDGVYCNGVERCDNQHGCVARRPRRRATTATRAPSTRATRPTQTCKHAPRDADGDGDPDVHCGGHDCDDNDPTVSSHDARGLRQRQGRQLQRPDRRDAVRLAAARHLRSTRSMISAPGTYADDARSARRFDYPTRCGLGSMPGRGATWSRRRARPPGPPVDVEVTATTTGSRQRSPSPVSAAILRPSSPAAPTFPSAQRRRASREARARALGSASEPTAYPVYVAPRRARRVTLDVAILARRAAGRRTRPAAPPRRSRPASRRTVEILDAAQNLGSACATPLGELVYSFTLAAAADVDVYASSVDGDGAADDLAARRRAARSPADEITCAYSRPGRTSSGTRSRPALLRRRLGHARRPTIERRPSSSRRRPRRRPTSPAPARRCSRRTRPSPSRSRATRTTSSSAASPAPSTPRTSSTSPRPPTCSSSSASRQGDTGAVGLGDAGVRRGDARSSARRAATSPVRASKRNVPAGDYRVVAESAAGERRRSSPPSCATPCRRRSSPSPTAAPTRSPSRRRAASSRATPPTRTPTSARAAINPAACRQRRARPAARRSTLTDDEARRPRHGGLGLQRPLLDVRQGPAVPGTEVPLGVRRRLRRRRRATSISRSPPGTYYDPDRRLRRRHGRMVPGRPRRRSREPAGVARSRPSSPRVLRVGATRGPRTRPTSRRALSHGRAWCSVPLDVDARRRRLLRRPLVRGHPRARRRRDGRPRSIPARTGASSR